MRGSTGSDDLRCVTDSAPLACPHTREGRYPPPRLAAAPRLTVPLRPCLDCGALCGATRCPPCQAVWQQPRDAQRRARRPDYTNAERTRRAQAVAAHRATYGDWCPGWGVAPHWTPDLTADHVLPVAAGGDETGPLRVVCRPCNSRRQARP